MTKRRDIRVLLVAESANPAWVSVPLEGWSLSRAISDLTDSHLATQIRNKPFIEETGWREGHEFSSIDSESVARPVGLASDWLRRKLKLGWTVTTASEALSYYAFERELCRKFKKDIAAHRFDIVHRITPLSPTIQSTSLIKVCQAAGVPFVWGPINGGIPWPKEFLDVMRKEGEWLSYLRELHKLMPGYRLSRAGAAALIAGSVSSWNQLKAYETKTVYIPENGIDLARFPPVAREQPNALLRVAFVGRLVPYKGADMLMIAAEPFIKSGRVALDIIGDGPERATLTALRDSMGLKDNVRIDGWVEHTKLRERLQFAHVFGFPSVREFGGGVVLEAMAMGLVPIVVGYGGPNELVTETTGFRIPIANRETVIAGVRKAIKALLDQPDTLRAMSSNARTRVLKHFTWERKAEQILECYDWVLRRGERPSYGMPFHD